MQYHVSLSASGDKKAVLASLKQQVDAASTAQPESKAGHAALLKEVTTVVNKAKAKDQLSVNVAAHVAVTVVTPPTT